MGSYDPTPPRTSLEDAHEATETQDGRREVKYPFAFKSLDWDDYHRYRPRYPDSMLKQWLSYHRQHGGEFHCAHDIGAGKSSSTPPFPPRLLSLSPLCSLPTNLALSLSLPGPGTLASRLAPLFTHMIVSDAGAANLSAAKASLAASSPTTKFTFLHTPAEQAHARLSPNSVDFVSVGMAFHYFDAPGAVRAIATMLKPGGTLAAATYGFRLRFPGRPALSRLWFAAVSAASLRLLRGGALFPAAVRGLAAAMAGLDFVELPEEWFEEGVVRVLVNAGSDEDDDDGEGEGSNNNNKKKKKKKSSGGGSSSSSPLAFVEEDETCWAPSVRRVGKRDVCVAMRDGGWRREADCAWLRGFLASCQMGFDERTWEMSEWRALEAGVRAAAAGPGGRGGGMVVVEWPVAMILATRNARPVV